MLVVLLVLVVVLVLTIRVLNAPLQGNHQGAQLGLGDGGSALVTNQRPKQYAYC